MKGMGHRKSFTDPSNEAVWCVQTEKKHEFYEYTHSRSDSSLLK